MVKKALTVVHIQIYLYAVCRQQQQQKTNKKTFQHMKRNIKKKHNKKQQKTQKAHLPNKIKIQNVNKH